MELSENSVEVFKGIILIAIVFGVAGMGWYIWSRFDLRGRSDPDHPLSADNLPLNTCPKCSSWDVSGPKFAFRRMEPQQVVLICSNCGHRFFPKYKARYNVHTKGPML